MMTTEAAEFCRKRDEKRQACVNDALKIEYEIEDWLSFDSDDPMKYVQQITGNIMLTLDEDRMEAVEIGKHKMCYVDFFNGVNHCEPVMICDEYSAELSTFYVSAYEDGEVYPRYEIAPDTEVAGMNFLYLETLVIEEKHRGNGFGIMACESAIRNFSHGCSVVATLPAPMNKDDSIKDFKDPDVIRAKLKLRADRKALGFQLIEDSDFMILNMSRKRPTVEEALQTYKERKLK